MNWLKEVLEDARRAKQQWPLWAGGDPRWHAMLARFRTLSNQEIRRILANRQRMCFDTWNFDEAEGTFCPMAIAMRLHLLENPSDKLVKNLLGSRFSPVNILKGVPGSFYRESRWRDLTYLCEFILRERGLTSGPPHAKLGL